MIVVWRMRFRPNRRDQETELVEKGMSTKLPEREERVCDSDSSSTYTTARPTNKD